jgi:hypothetical protein
MMTLMLILGLTTSTPQPRAQRIDVDDDEVVEGGLANAEGQAVFARKQAKFGSLLRLRSDFRPELIHSADRD